MFLDWSFCMKNWHLQVLNIVVFLMMAAFGLLALFGNAMSAVSSPGVTFAVYTAFLWWIVFYVIQFLSKTVIWKITWFFISLVVLWFWMFGGGAWFWELVFE